jgi:hypothetical protein
VSSPPQPDPSGAIGTAQALAEALNGVSVRLDDVKTASEDRDAELKRYGRHNRMYVLFDIAITLLFALGGYQIADASHRADTATASAAAATASESALHSAQLSGCEVGNQERAGELALWTYLFDASKPASKAQEQAVDKFMTIVAATFAPRNCARAYPLPPAKGTASGTG